MHLNKNRVFLLAARVAISDKFGPPQILIRPLRVHCQEREHLAAATAIEKLLRHNFAKWTAGLPLQIEGRSANVKIFESDTGLEARVTAPTEQTFVGADGTVSGCAQVAWAIRDSLRCVEFRHRLPDKAGGIEAGDAR